MKKYINSDFNSIFWKILGVTNKKRIFHPNDIFSVERNINEERSYDSELKLYKSFLKGECLPKNFAYFYFLDTLVLDSFIKENSNNNEDINFYLEQIKLIVVNYKMIEQINLKNKSKYTLNIISFIIATIFAHMCHKKYDTSAFLKSINKASFEPMLEFLKEKTKFKYYNGLAKELSDSNEEYFVDNSDVKFTFDYESILEETYKKNISLWRNNKKLPTLKDMFLFMPILINCKIKKEEAVIFFLQSIIIRSLMYLNNKFNCVNEFLKSFNEKIYSLEKIFKNKEFNDLLFTEQKKNKILDIKYYYIKNNNTDVVYSSLFKDSKELFEDDEIMLPKDMTKENVLEFISIFSKIEKKFNNECYPESLFLLNKLDYFEKDYLLEIELIIQIKLYDKKNIKKLLKRIDIKFMGGTMMLAGGSYDSQILIDLIKDLKNLDECINIIRDFIVKKYPFFGNYQINNSNIIFSS